MERKQKWMILKYPSGESYVNSFCSGICLTDMHMNRNTFVLRI